MYDAIARALAERRNVAPEQIALDLEAVGETILLDAIERTVYPRLLAA